MKPIRFYSFLLFSFILLFSCNSDSDISRLRNQHAYFLEKSPVKNINHLSKKERKELGIPNEKYLERMWELTMNPSLGYPTTEKLFEIQKELDNNRSVPGDAINAWIERGPNNVGGRTKALLFDPNDLTYKRVFAGSVSGGLWKNDDITSNYSQWQLMNFPENVAVSSLQVDVNNSQIFYAGTGESYTYGSVNGNGVWKSIDGGNNWFHVFGGITGATVFNTNALLHINSPATLEGDYNGFRSSFGPQNFNITANLALVNDGSVTPTLSCNTLINPSEINGKIAVIERGTCLFVDKITYAQNAGAIGVIMINNAGGNPITMGGDLADDIVIPAIMISKSEGMALLSSLNSNETINATISSVDNQFSGAYIIPGQTHINDVVTRNNAGTTEIYVAVGDSYYSDASPVNIMGTSYQGIYKSIDGGSTWVKLFLPNTASGYPYTPNDLEIGPDNTIWMSTTRSPWYGIEGGGSIFSSADGELFTLKYTFTNGKRTEISVSKSNPNKLYVLIDVNDTSNPTAIYKTTNGFSSVTSVSLPVDGYIGIPSNDFTNGQGFYDLAIEVDPNNDETVFVGGIDWFKSSNGGSSWSQITAGYGGSGSSIHPDQHGISFSGSNKIVIGCDGGVAFSLNGGASFSPRINNYNTVQFYHMGVAPTTALTGDYFIGGSQDNGTQLFANASAGINGSVQAYGADGGYCFFDQDGTDKYYITNIYYNNNIRLYNYANGTTRTINSESTNKGEFITQQALDSKQNILYSNYTTYDAANAANNVYQIRRYKSLLSGTVQTALITGFTNSLTAMKISPFGTTTVATLFVGQQDGKLFKVNNAQSTSYSLVEITGSEFVGSISDIEFGATSSEIFVTMFNYGVKSVWYTSNAGTSWTSKEGDLPDMPVNCILRNPLRPDQVIIGTDLGVWWTQNFSDANPSWYRGDNGMKSVKVTNLELRNDNKVFASTYGRGIFSGQFTADDGTIGIDDSLDNISASLSPNPAKDFTVLTSKIELTNPIVYIYNTNGQLVNTQKYIAKNSNFRINTNRLKSGSYIVKIHSDQNQFSLKLIVN